MQKTASNISVVMSATINVHRKSRCSDKLSMMYPCLYEWINEPFTARNVIFFFFFLPGTLFCLTGKLGLATSVPRYRSGILFSNFHRLSFIFFDWKFMIRDICATLSIRNIVFEFQSIVLHFVWLWSWD